MRESRIFAPIRNQPLDLQVRELRQLARELATDCDPEILDPICAHLDELSQRLSIDTDICLVGLIGATGSGKSSLVNALVGSDIAAVGLRRPTTTNALAVCPVGQVPHRLLDWLGIDSRVLVPSGISGHEALGDSVVVLDLPDIDSLHSRNRNLVQRLASRIDVLVWVVDPQKYADHVLHAEFVRKFVDHADNVVTVLTHVDTLSKTDSVEVVADIERLLREDGIAHPRVIAVSNVTHEGIAQLRLAIRDVTRRQREHHTHTEVSIRRLRSQLNEALGINDMIRECGLPRLDVDSARNTLTSAAEHAVGVPALCSAVERSYRHRGGRVSGWLPLTLVRRLRRDPLQRWHLAGDARDTVMTALPAETTSGDHLPSSGEERPMHILATAIRRVNDTMTGDVNPHQRREGEILERPRVWRNTLSRVVCDAGEELVPRLSRAVAGIDRGVLTRTPAWWTLSRWIQILGWITAVVGLGWLGAVVIARHFLLINLDVPYYGAIPIPTWTVIVGIGWTIIVAVITTMLIRVRSRVHGRRATRGVCRAVRDTVEATMIEAIVNEDRRQRRLWQMLTH